MKLTNVQAIAASPSGLAFGQNEARDDREKRMKLFWAAPENAVLYPVGRLLAVMADKTQTIADVLVAGGEVEMDSITVAGKVLPLLPGFKMSLSNIQAWGCVACRSAHGSGTYPSCEINSKLLVSNKFYYNPATKVLFTISATCWEKYTKAILGAAIETRFCSPASVKATTLKPAAVKA